MTRLSKLVEAAVPRFGNYQRIADAAGFTLSALMRALKGGGILGVDKLVALAEAIGADPADVLRAAGKEDVAEILERVYGTPLRPLNAIDRALLKLPADTKRAVLKLTK
jgi:hypothetical protein